MRNFVVIKQIVPITHWYFRFLFTADIIFRSYHIRGVSKAVRQSDLIVHRIRPWQRLSAVSLIVYVIRHSYLKWTNKFASFSRSFAVINSLCVLLSTLSCKVCCHKWFNLAFSALTLWFGNRKCVQPVKNPLQLFSLVLFWSRGRVLWKDWGSYGWWEWWDDWVRAGGVITGKERRLSRYRM